MRQFFAALLLLSLAACGFQPVYAPGSSALAAGGPITVEPIPGRSGYKLRRALQEELAIGLPGVTDPATLNVAPRTVIWCLTCWLSSPTARRRAQVSPPPVAMCWRATAGPSRALWMPRPILRFRLGLMATLPLKPAPMIAPCVSSQNASSMICDYSSQPADAAKGQAGCYLLTPARSGDLGGAGIR